MGPAGPLRSSSASGARFPASGPEELLAFALATTAARVEERCRELRCGMAASTGDAVRAHARGELRVRRKRHMHSLTAFLLVFLGAGLGGTLRHGVNLAAARMFGTGSPFGTLAVNIGGSLLMGLLAGWFAHKADPGQSWRLFLVTGVLGGFTTFSAFSLDAGSLYERDGFGMAAFYVAISVGVSIASFFLGLLATRHIV